MQDNVYRIEHLNKSYENSNGDRIQVFRDLSLKIEKGKITALLGPSGCGKSTLLNVLAGFEAYDSGTVPSQEGMGVVFQSPALFPWLTVEGNIAYGLKRKKVHAQERRERIDSYIKLVQLEDYRSYYPRELSGGMQQRAALARTLVLHPEVLLMDEPFSALDPKLRFQMQQLTLNLWKELNQTILIVTHDVEEALILADTIYLMEECPGGVRRIVHVPWQEKDAAVRDTKDFFELKKSLLNSEN